MCVTHTLGCIPFTQGRDWLECPSPYLKPSIEQLNHALDQVGVAQREKFVCVCLLLSVFMRTRSPFENEKMLKFNQPKDLSCAHCCWILSG